MRFPCPSSRARRLTQDRAAKDIVYDSQARHHRSSRWCVEECGGLTARLDRNLVRVADCRWRALPMNTGLLRVQCTIPRCPELALEYIHLGCVSRAASLVNSIGLRAITVISLRHRSHSVAQWLIKLGATDLLGGLGCAIRDQRAPLSVDAFL